MERNNHNNHSSRTRDNKLFGTDGIRGVANVEPVTAETALKLGRAAAHYFKNLKRKSKEASFIRIPSL